MANGSEPGMPELEIIARLRELLFGPPPTPSSPAPQTPATEIINLLRQVPVASGIASMVAQRGWVYYRQPNTTSVVAGQTTQIFSETGPGFIYLIQMELPSNEFELQLIVDGTEQITSIDEITAFDGGKLVPLSMEWYLTYLNSSLTDIAVTFNTDTGFPFRKSVLFRVKNTSKTTQNIVRYRWKIWLV